MPLPADLLKTVLALEELHDFTREFTATGGKAYYINLLLKRRLHKRLRHVQVKKRVSLSLQSIEAIIFTGADPGVGDVIS